MTQFEAVFTSKADHVCRKCGKDMRLIKRRIHHVLQHVFKETDCRNYSCTKCDHTSMFLSIVEIHARTHITDKTKKNDPKEIRKYFKDQFKANEKVISKMGRDCFGSSMNIVRRTIKENVAETENADDDHEQDVENVQDDIPMEETEDAEPQSLEMIEPTPVRAMLLPTIKDEETFQQSNQIQPVAVLGRNVKNECHWIDLDDEVRQNHELEVVMEDQEKETEGSVPAPLAGPANSEVFINYRFQKEWDTEELIANMRAVGGMLKFSKNVIDMAMDVIRENVMDGALVSYEDENLTDFFKNCPVVYGIKTAIIKMLQAMGLKELNS